MSLAEERIKELITSMDADEQCMVARYLDELCLRNELISRINEKGDKK